MNFGDIFRSFFGFSNKSRIPQESNLFENSDDPKYGRGRNQPDTFFFFGNAPPFFESRTGPDLEEGPMKPGGHGPDDQGEFGSGIFDMHKQFESMFQQFEGIFQGLSHGGHFPAIDKEPSHEGNDDPESLRDHMLKDPDSESGHPPGSLHPSPGLPSIFGRLFGDSQPGPGKVLQEDTDLDAEVRKGNLDSILGPPPSGMSQNYRSTEPRPDAMPYQSYKSLSVSSFRRADGHMEERSTVQDGRGNEQTTVRRIIGDQGHTHTVLRDNAGSQKVKEDFINLGPEEKANFDQRWQGKRLPRGGDIFRGKAWPEGGEIDRHTKALFGNLFGKGFPGFGDD